MNEIFDKERKEKNEELLRPQKLSDYSGQQKIVENLSVFIKSAKIRGTTLDHVLLYGPPGLGKTTLAKIIANEMGAQFVTTSGPAIEKPGDLASMLVSLQDGDVIFIDEIHRMSKNVEEILYPAMEDFAIDIFVGEGDGSKAIRINLPRFTLIGATTKAGALSSPLRDRFGSVNRLNLYTPEELCQILTRDAKIIGIDADKNGIAEIARRARGTPRIAIRILQRIRDFAVVQGTNKITKEIAQYGLKALEIDEIGLDNTDLMILKAIHENFKDGPVGIDTLSSFIGEDPQTVEDVSEPFLMQSGLIAKTPRGRILTDKGFNHLMYGKSDISFQDIAKSNKILKRKDTED